SVSEARVMIESSVLPPLAAPSSTSISPLLCRSVPQPNICLIVWIILLSGPTLALAPTSATPSKSLARLRTGLAAGENTTRFRCAVAGVSGEGPQEPLAPPPLPGPPPAPDPLAPPEPPEPPLPEPPLPLLPDPDPEDI